VVGCDSVDLTALRFSKFCHSYFVHPDPADDEDAYIESLIEKIEYWRPEDDTPYVLMPLFDNARLLARRKSELPDYIKLAAPDAASIDFVYPKDRLVRSLGALRDFAPESRIIEERDDVEAAAADLDFPLVLKPAEGVGGRGVEFVDDLEELLSAYNQLSETLKGPFVLQETAEGEDFCMTAIADHGEVRAAMAYKNLDTFPKKSGAGTVRETVDHAPFLEATEAILKYSNWTGVAEIDFRWTGKEEDAPKLIEVNARFWAGLYHSMASGVDYPWLLYQLTAYDAISESANPIIGKVTRTPVLSTMSMISSILSRSIRFPVTRRVVGSGWRLIREEGEWREGLRRIWRGLKGAVAFDKAAFITLEKMDQSRDAPTEFDHADDPYAGLGFLFILSSLRRYGRLPDEVKY
jgi:predicted ATP-grasp superfamily ATP-dependent carboligase